MELYQVYYLLSMGAIESIKLGKAWRLVPEVVEEYDKQHPERKNRNITSHFIYSGDGGFLFRSLPDDLPIDFQRQSSSLQRRRRAVVYQSDGHQELLFPELELVEELFSA
jgi:hypothetical protein